MPTFSFDNLNESSFSLTRADSRHATKGASYARPRTTRPSQPRTIQKASQRTRHGVVTIGMHRMRSQRIAAPPSRAFTNCPNRNAAAQPSPSPTRNWSSRASTVSRAGRSSPSTLKRSRIIRSVGSTQRSRGGVHRSGLRAPARMARLRHAGTRRDDSDALSAGCDSNIYTAAILGDETAVRGFLARDPKSATATGGPHEWDALTLSLLLALSAHSTKRVQRRLCAPLERCSMPEPARTPDGTR